MDRRATGQTGSQQNQGQTGSTAQGGAQQNQGQTTQHRQSQLSRISRFEFAYSLPEEIKPKEVVANFRNGVLELRLPKAQPSALRNKAVTIPIQGASNTAQLPAQRTSREQRQAPMPTPVLSTRRAHAPAMARAPKQNEGQAGQSTATAAEIQIRTSMRCARQGV